MSNLIGQKVLLIDSFSITAAMTGVLQVYINSLFLYVIASIRDVLAHAQGWSLPPARNPGIGSNLLYVYKNDEHI